jgi:putative SOS response-associated peptidase YedK
MTGEAPALSRFELAAAALRALGIPFRAKDIKIGFSTFNARAENIERKPAFREAFKRRCCLVPLDNFYEWKKTPTSKQPYAVGLADRLLMAMAGLWETWRSPVGERMRSFTIVTTTPNALCAELHDRMPVVLKPGCGRCGSAKSRPTRPGSSPCSSLIRRTR